MTQETFQMDGATFRVTRDRKGNVTRVQEFLPAVGEWCDGNVGRMAMVMGLLATGRA
jgi:hypothetical protein